MNLNYKNLSDEEIKDALKGITKTANSEQEIREQVKNVLGYEWIVAASMTTSESWEMKMSMVMMYNKNWEVLSI